MPLTPHRAARLLLGVLVALLLPATIASAAPGLGTASPISSARAGTHARVTGVRAHAVSAAAEARALAALTGLTPAQATVRSACPPAPVGWARCAALAVARRGSRHLAAARVRAGARPERILRPSRAGSAAALSPALAAAQPAPQAGTPGYLQQAYDLTALAQTAGGNATVAIVDAYHDPTAESDLRAYRSAFGLPACSTANGCLRIVNGQGGSTLPTATDSNWQIEESLDVDAVSALCPNCHILLIEAADAYSPELASAMQEAGALGATVVSASFGGPSSVAEDWGLTVPTVAATGDNGYDGGGDATSLPLNSYPAALPGVTAAGGTSLAADTSRTGGRGYAESAWSGAGSGCDLVEAKPSWQVDDGCAGRSYADISAVANPDTGLGIVWNGGWYQVGGTSLATPLVAAYYALTGKGLQGPSWAYAASGLLNDPASGNNRTASASCTADVLYLCAAGRGYDGPTGVGSISGAVVTGAPGIGAPTSVAGGRSTYASSVSAGSATLTGGVYPNGLDTTYWWEYGTTSAYGQRTQIVDVGAGTAPVALTATLANLTPGTQYHLRLVAQNSAGTTVGYDDTLTTPAGAPPVSTGAPAVSGGAVEGATLTADPGTWSMTGTASYEWQRATAAGWQDIAGAAGATYPLSDADVAAQVRVLVSLHGSDGVSSAPSAAVGPIGTAPPTSTAAPVITGVPAQGRTLTATAGGWAPGGGFSYVWARCDGSGANCSPISGATAAAHVVDAADVGGELTVTVTATNASGTASRTSAPAGPVLAAAPAAAAAPHITGSPVQGSALTAGTGTWSPPGTVTYAWERCDTVGQNCATIAGATGQTYTTGTADAAHRIVAVVTESNGTGQASASSGAFGPVLPIAPLASAGPSISGTPWRGQTISLDTGTWNTWVQTAVQWSRCDASGFTCTPISGATATTYALTAADVGAGLRASVTARNSAGTTVAGTALFGPVTLPPPVDVTLPTVGGAPLVAGRSLTADPGTWDPTGTFAYTWERCDATGANCAAVPGATGSTYTLGSADVGAEIAIAVTATDTAGSRTATSAPAGPVLSVPTAVTQPAVSGRATRGATLTATPGAWSTAVTTSLQWQRCAVAGACSDIPGATDATYVLGAADVGDTVLVRVTAHNGAAVGTAGSAAIGPVSPGRPVALTAPAITGTPTVGAALSLTPGAWDPGGAATVQWQRCDAAGCAAVDGATALDYTPTVLDVGASLQALVTETNVDGTTTVASGPSRAVVPAALPPVPAVAAVPVTPSASIAAPALPSPPRIVIAGTPSIGGSVVVDPGAAARASTVLVRFFRCAPACAAVAPPGPATRMRLGAADVGAYLRATVTVAGPGGSSTVWADGAVGPVHAPGAASGAVSPGAAVVLRSVTGRPLGRVSEAPVRAGSARDTSVTVTRAAGARGALSVWACAVGRDGPATCTAARPLVGAVRLTVRPRAGERLVVVLAPSRRRR